MASNIPQDAKGKSSPNLPPKLRIASDSSYKRILDKLGRSNSKEPRNYMSLVHMITGAWITQSLSVIARLEIPDQMDIGQSYSVDSIAEANNLHFESLYRLMRGLSSVGIFEELEGKSFQLTSLGEYLREDHPHSLKYLSIFQGDPNWVNWSALEYSIKSGKPAIEYVLGETIRASREKHSSFSDIFDKAIANVSALSINSILETYDFSKHKVIAEISERQGYLLASILLKYRQSTGAFCSHPKLANIASLYFDEIKLGNRIHIYSCNYLHELPCKADLYILYGTLQLFSDREAIQILDSIRKIIPKHGKILIIGMIIPEKNVPHFSKLLDLEMLVLSEGKERTFASYNELLICSGFKMEAVHSTSSQLIMIEAVPD